MGALPASSAVDNLLAALFGRDTSSTPAPDMTPHDDTFWGLVDEANTLQYVIGSDLSFAHRSGAALAMIPVGVAEDAGNDPDEDLLENYREVANMVSRAVNEVASCRVRLDPGLPMDDGERQGIVESGEALQMAVEIAGYGSGALAIWSR